MQFPKYEIENFYAETVQSILFTAFYQCLLPFGIVWCLLSLTVLYFTHKVVENFIKFIIYQLKLFRKQSESYHFQII